MSLLSVFSPMKNLRGRFFYLLYPPMQYFIVSCLLILQLWLLKGEICMVFNISCWYFLPWFWCNYCPWGSKFMEFTGNAILNYQNFFMVYRLFDDYFWFYPSLNLFITLHSFVIDTYQNHPLINGNASFQTAPSKYSLCSFSYWRFVYH